VGAIFNNQQEITPTPSCGSRLARPTLQIMGNRHASLFIGQGAPTVLILGLYNKLVKQLGSD
jgi:hypothetical protein